MLRVRVKESDPTAVMPLTPPGSCTAQLAYLDVNAGQVASRGKADGPLCSGLPLADALAAVIQQLLAKADGPPRGMLAISSAPEGAQVHVDGLPRGTTPYLKPSFAGPHQILAEKADFQPCRTRVDVVRDQVVTTQILPVAQAKEELEPSPAPLLAVPVQLPPRRLITRSQPRPF